MSPGISGTPAAAARRRNQPRAQQLLYSTVFGGNTSTGVATVSVDPAGVITITGATQEPNFPTTPNAWDTSFSGSRDGFITRLDPSQTGAQQLVYSTFIDSGGGYFVMDSAGVMTLAGAAWTANFPTTPGAFDATYNGGGDVFVAHLDLGPTLGISQPQGPGTPITIDNGYLIPGYEYFNIFSLDLCPAGPGTGPYLGLCATTLANVQFLVLQASLPVGSPPFHFIAPAASAS